MVSRETNGAEVDMLHGQSGRPLQARALSPEYDGVVSVENVTELRTCNAQRNPIHAESCCRRNEEAWIENATSFKSRRIKTKVKGLKLLSHEQQLLDDGALTDITHVGSSSIWLTADSTSPADSFLTVVYRPMGDEECKYLLTHCILPDTQPYQTIVEGAEGRIYAEKYLRGHKSVDSSPTTVVEFIAPRALVAQLFAMQSKNEDGAISHGLGNKGGQGLPLFNSSLHSGESTFRIVFVKRFEKKAIGAFGRGRKKM